MDRNTQYRIEASGITVEVDLGVGHLALFEVERDGRSSAPFHRAPWADDAAPPAGTEGAPHLARISGDFFCAPFSTSDVEAAPSHGWPANAAWTPRRQPAGEWRRHDRDVRCWRSRSWARAC